MNKVSNTLPALAGEDLVQWLGQVYASASPDVQCCLLEHLMRPLGVLALLRVGGSIFARIRLQSGRPDMPIGPQYLPEVDAADVMALADHARQRSDEAVRGLCRFMASLAAQGSLDDRMAWVYCICHVQCPFAPWPYTPPWVCMQERKHIMPKRHVKSLLVTLMVAAGRRCTEAAAVATNYTEARRPLSRSG